VKAGNIRKGMRVLDHRGTLHGTVDAVKAGRVRIMRRGVDGMEGHWMPAGAVEWVDHAVHLFQGANDVGVGAITGSGTGEKPAPRHPAEFGEKRWRGIPLPWFVGLVGLVLVAVVATTVMRGDRRGASQGTAGVALPGGHNVSVAPGGLADDLQRFLASGQPVPRTFIFRTIDFDEGEAAIPSGTMGDVNTVARILAAYPKARVQVVGYADVPKNVRVAVDVQTAAELGRRRAAALAGALTAAGVPHGAIEPLSGNDPDYIDNVTPATAKDAGDRHPDLIVTRK
jgi:outer membrane protein OmpA-like peptidoglycan-associated protein